MVLARSFWLNSAATAVVLAVLTYTVAGLVHALWVEPPACDERTIMLRMAEEIGDQYNVRRVFSDPDGLNELLLPYVEHLPHRVKILSTQETRSDQQSRSCELEGLLYFDEDVATETMRLARDDPYLRLPKDEERDVPSFVTFTALLQNGYFSRVSYRVQYEGSRVPAFTILRMESHLRNPR